MLRVEICAQKRKMFFSIFKPGRDGQSDLHSTEDQEDAGSTHRFGTFFRGESFFLPLITVGHL